MTETELLYASPNEVLAYAQTRPANRTDVVLHALRIKIVHLETVWPHDTVTIAERLQLISDVAIIADLLNHVFTHAAEQVTADREEQDDANES